MLLQDKEKICGAIMKIKYKIIVNDYLRKLILLVA